MDDNEHGFITEVVPPIPAKPFVIRMSSDLLLAVKAKAAAEERSVAQTIRHALRLYVNGDLDG